MNNSEHPASKGPGNAHSDYNAAGIKTNFAGERLEPGSQNRPDNSNLIQIPRTREEVQKEDPGAEGFYFPRR